METLRNLINFLAMLFVVFVLLVLLNVVSVEYLDSTLTTFNPENFYLTVMAISGVMLLLVLGANFLYALSLRREKVQLQNQINELKAKLYDRKASSIPEETRSPDSPVPPFTSGSTTTFPDNNPPVKPS